MLRTVAVAANGPPLFGSGLRSAEGSGDKSQPATIYYTGAHNSHYQHSASGACPFTRAWGRLCDGPIGGHAVPQRRPGGRTGAGLGGVQPPQRGGIPLLTRGVMVDTAAFHVGAFIWSERSGQETPISRRLPFAGQDAGAEPPYIRARGAFHLKAGAPQEPCPLTPRALRACVARKRPYPPYATAPTAALAGYEVWPQGSPNAERALEGPGQGPRWRDPNTPHEASSSTTPSSL
ncbi:hypothetical protein WJX73_000338 [Symbiochloris irregularis]|uniref:Uncharacterized protein n=1 Tax=Symbiochloris irregularis TaxID=706552 RepID=A0AAW1P0E0_9CHLO